MSELWTIVVILLIPTLVAAVGLALRKPPEEGVPSWAMAHVDHEVLNEGLLMDEYAAGILNHPRNCPGCLAFKQRVFQARKAEMYADSISNGGK